MTGIEFIRHLKKRIKIETNMNDYELLSLMFGKGTGHYVAMNEIDEDLVTFMNGLDEIINELERKMLYAEFVHKLLANGYEYVLLIMKGHRVN